MDDNRQQDEKDLGIKLQSPSSEKEFNILFNKELNIDITEVPVVLFELHENSLLYMDSEEWDRALLLLQKAQSLIERLNIENYK